jgi:phospholipid/cholesterol/gamma-HCH transport system substrate-binding protein
MERNLAQEIKVGLALLGVLLLLGVVIFVLGGSSALLEDRYRLNASFADISGLRVGAVVRLAGIDVGEVTHIEFAEDVGERRVYVEFNMMESYRTRIREDSIASIQTEGVLGDKYIAISMGSPDEKMLVHGDWISTEEPLEWLSYMDKAGEILDQSAGISRKVNFMLGEDQDSARASLANAIFHLEQLIAEMENGDGLLHALVYDDELARSVKRTAANLEEGSAGLARMTAEIESGDGFAHEMVFGEEGRRLAEQMGGLAGTLSQLSEDIQHEEGLVHALVYDTERARMVEDLHATASALREVAEAIEQGQGTAGMLANDPALYEDLRALMGGAQRNKLLKAYIRRTVARAEEQDATSFEEPSP